MNKKLEEFIEEYSETYLFYFVLFGCLFIGFVVGMFFGLWQMEKSLDKNDFMYTDTYADRQSTLIYCDHVYGNCANKAREWFKENPDWTSYNFSVENASWFGGEPVRNSKGERK